MSSLPPKFVWDPAEELCRLSRWTYLTRPPAIPQTRKTLAPFLQRRAVSPTCSGTPSAEVPMNVPSTGCGGDCLGALAPWTTRAFRGSFQTSSVGAGRGCGTTPCAGGYCPPRGRRALVAAAPTERTATATLAAFFQSMSRLLSGYVDNAPPAVMTWQSLSGAFPAPHDGVFVSPRVALLLPGIESSPQIETSHPKDNRRGLLPWLDVLT